ncbi:hypothetical protein [Lysinibacillus sp. 54212]|uniref:hypothetical protein n=1 Tax=Lysinibacillus sp. 54212 TaxID=3119829 RepID=UPI002FC6C740
MMFTKVLILCCILLFNLSNEKYQPEIYAHQTLIELVNNPGLQIESVNSFVVDLNDRATEVLVKAVRYEVVLGTNEATTIQNISRYSFEVDDLSTLNLKLIPVGNLTLLKNTQYGTRYSLAFETMYGKYTEYELKHMIDNQSFQIMFSRIRE